MAKSTEESSYETLESLAAHLNRRILKYFIYPYQPFIRSLEPATLNTFSWSQVRICVEKPTAVVLADAPVIEIVRTSDPTTDGEALKLHGEWLDNVRRRGALGTRAPFPLQGTLSSWIKTNFPEDTT